MGLAINFYSTRSDASNDFWWETTDPAVIQQRNKITEIADNLNISYNQTKSEDGLTLTSKFIVEDISYWEFYKYTVLQDLPNFNNDRETYFMQNNHHLQLIVINEVDNSIVTQRTLV